MNSQDKILIGTAEADDALSRHGQERRGTSDFAPLRQESRRLASEVLPSGDSQDCWDGRVD